MTDAPASPCAIDMALGRHVLLLAGVIVAVTAPARAEPPPGRKLVAGGLYVNADSATFLGAVAFAAEATYPLGGPFHAHGMLGFGQTVRIATMGFHEGFFGRASGGVEAIACAAGQCAFAGLELGLQTQFEGSGDGVVVDTYHHNGVSLGPRLGFELGGASVRVRLSVDLFGYKTASKTNQPRLGGGASLMLAIGARI